MQKNRCPNYVGCQIITEEDFVPDNDKKQYYMSTYCKAGQKRWILCNRFQTSVTLNFCPDFVLPDTNFTIDEILDKFEE